MYVTADSASSQIIDTNILSTTLYNAWISIDNIAGQDMEIISFPTGIVPILFS
jgi:hypothetical protein